MASGTGVGPVPTSPFSPESKLQTSGGGGIQDSPESTPSKATSLCPNVAIPQDILPIPQAMAKANVIIGLPALRQFLQPRHSYFKDKQANIEGFRSYKHEGDEAETVFVYPEVKGQTRYASTHNPYRKYQLSRSHSGRTAGELRGVILNNELKDFRMAEVVTTMPAEVSKALSERANGKDIAWRTFKRFYAQLPYLLGVDAGEFACGSNLHVWASDEPLKPHYHVHSLIPNYLVCYGEPNVFTKWFGGGIIKRYQEKEGKWRTGCVSFSSEQLLKIKKGWTKAVRDMCHRYGIRVPYFADKTALCDVYTSFSKWEDTSFGRARLIHKVNYQKRSWVEDYATYSNVHTDCPDPPSWLEGYSNRTRAFGWWMRLSELAGETVDSKAKISPLTGEPMVAVDRQYLLDVLEGPLAALDVVKGRPVWWVLDDEDRRWLYGACGQDCQGYPGHMQGNGAGSEVGNG
jgi:hypothetical protein